MSIKFLFIIFFAGFLLSVVLTFIIRQLALYFNIIDKPEVERKVHQGSIPLLGGLAVFLSFFSCLYFLKNYLLAGNLEVWHWLGFFIGGIFLMVGGFLDDKFRLNPSQQIIWPILAIIFIIMGGVGIEKVTNPFGGIIYLGHFKLIFTFIWLLIMMYTTKLLDGLDGLVSGVVGIGALIIFLFTMTTKYYQPDIGVAALVLSASCFGFLVFNWHPAKIFLGEGGSLFLGYALGVLAIISGGKIAIALLILGIPLLDLVWTIIRRSMLGKNPFKSADRLHLHHQLLDLGLGQRKTVIIFYLITTFFGISGLFLQSKGKILALITLLLLMFLTVIGLNIINKSKLKNKQ